MVIGIIGAEAEKFTPAAQAEARAWIIEYVLQASKVVSGECHLGGIDIWAHETAERLGVPFECFPPKTLRWNDGYRPRNIQIAQAADLIVSIVVDVLPPTYTSQWRFPTCYHCAREQLDASHVKSGACWTANYARRLGKRTTHIVVSNRDGTDK